MTNEEWLKSLSTEEFASFLEKISNNCCDCPCGEDFCIQHPSCSETFAAWLKQEHKNEK